MIGKDLPNRWMLGANGIKEAEVEADPRVEEEEEMTDLWTIPCLPNDVGAEALERGKHLPIPWTFDLVLGVVLGVGAEMV